MLICTSEERRKVGCQWSIREVWQIIVGNRTVDCSPNLHLVAQGRTFSTVEYNLVVQCWVSQSNKFNTVFCNWEPKKSCIIIIHHCGLTHFTCLIQQCWTLLNRNVDPFVRGRKKKELDKYFCLWFCFQCTLFPNCMWSFTTVWAAQFTPRLSGIAQRKTEKSGFPLQGSHAGWVCSFFCCHAWRMWFDHPYLAFLKQIWLIIINVWLVETTWFVLIIDYEIIIYSHH